MVFGRFDLSSSPLRLPHLKYLLCYVMRAAGLLLSAPDHLRSCSFQEGIVCGTFFRLWIYFYFDFQLLTGS